MTEEASLDYEDRVRAIALGLAVKSSPQSRSVDAITKLADEFASYIANGMTCDEYKELQGEEFNIYKRTKAERELSDG